MNDSNVATLPKRESIAAGTVVKLKSGGAPMVITERLKDNARCLWHDTNCVLQDEFIPVLAIQVDK